MPKWIADVWGWLWNHRQGIFGGTVVAFIAFLLGAMKWYYEVKEYRRKERERKLEEEKTQVLKALRMKMAYTGLNGQKIEAIVADSGLKQKIVERALHGLANESPARAHFFNGRWYIGPFPVEILTQRF